MATDYNFVETDSAKLYTAIVGNLMDYCDEPLYPGDERRIFGEALVAVLVSLYNEFNDKMKQRTLQNARGYVLDAIGDMFYRVERAAPAQAMRHSGLPWMLPCRKMLSSRLVPGSRPTAASTLPRRKPPSCRPGKPTSIFWASARRAAVITTALLPEPSGRWLT